MMSHSWISRWLPRWPWLLWGLLVALLAAYGWTWSRLPGTGAGAPERAAPMEWPAPALPDPAAWSIVRSVGGASAAPNSRGLAARYRLAGTFVLIGPEWGPEEVRKAVLDDLDQQKQHLVAEGDAFDSITVVRVYRDHVTLRHDGREEDLWLSFSGVARGGATAATADQPQQDLRWDERVVETTPWGNRIADNRWILKRDQLLRYYEDVMNDPERLANLFISMRPVVSREEGNEITGYVLRPKGETEFYQGVGFREGDIVRKVNSMRMVRQERAEYFIREFMEGRLDAVVIDVERDGKEQQLIYYIR